MLSVQSFIVIKKISKVVDTLVLYSWKLFAMIIEFAICPNIKQSLYREKNTKDVLHIQPLSYKYTNFNNLLVGTL